MIGLLSLVCDGTFVGTQLCWELQRLASVLVSDFPSAMAFNSFIGFQTLTLSFTNANITYEGLLLSNRASKTCRKRFWNCCRSFSSSWALSRSFSFDLSSDCKTASALLPVLPVVDIGLFYCEILCAYRGAVVLSRACLLSSCTAATVAGSAGTPPSSSSNCCTKAARPWSQA